MPKQDARRKFRRGPGRKSDTTNEKLLTNRNCTKVRDAATPHQTNNCIKAMRRRCQGGSSIAPTKRNIKKLPAGEKKWQKHHTDLPARQFGKATSLAHDVMQCLMVLPLLRCIRPMLQGCAQANNANHAWSYALRLSDDVLNS